MKTDFLREALHVMANISDFECYVTTDNKKALEVVENYIDYLEQAIVDGPESPGSVSNLREFFMKDYKFYYESKK